MKVNKSYTITTGRFFNPKATEVKDQVVYANFIGNTSDKKLKDFAKENGYAYVDKVSEIVRAEMSIEDFHKYATPVLEFDFTGEEENSEPVEVVTDQY